MVTYGERLVPFGSPCSICSHIIRMTAVGHYYSICCHHVGSPIDRSLSSIAGPSAPVPWTASGLTGCPPPPLASPKATWDAPDANVWPCYDHLPLLAEGDWPARSDPVQRWRQRARAHALPGRMGKSTEALQWRHALSPHRPLHVHILRMRSLCALKPIDPLWAIAFSPSVATLGNEGAERDQLASWPRIGPIQAGCVRPLRPCPLSSRVAAR
jgi:hypothetical protein